MERNYFEKVHRNEITSKSEVQTALAFVVSKTFDNNFLSIKNKSKSAPRICISFPSKLHQKIPRNYVEFFVHRNWVEKSIMEIMSKEICENEIDILLIKTALNKVRRDDTDFSSIKITLKKYVEMTLKFVDIFSLTCRRNIAIELTLIWRGVSVGK